MFFYIYFGAIFLSFLISLVGVYQIDRSNLTETQRENVLEVVDQKGSVVGYLVGSIHCNLTQEELLPLMRTLEVLISKVNDIFLECVFTHWTSLPEGVERKVLEISGKEEREVISLEDYGMQKVLIASLFAWNKKTYNMPYGWLLFKAPTLCSILNILKSIAWGVPGLVAQMLKPSIVQETHNENVRKIESYRKSFLKGLTPSNVVREGSLFAIKRRDQEMFKKLQHHMGGFSEKRKFLMAIGAMHLSIDQGIVDQFEKAGYTLRPFEIVDLVG